MISSLYISFARHSWMLIPLIIICGVFVYWIYRRTVPEISHGLRILFIILRTMVIILLLVMIFNPIFVLKEERRKKPGLAVLIDGSASMSIKDGSGIRSNYIDELLSDDYLKNFEDSFEADYYIFSDSLIKLDNLENLSFDGTSSNIAYALESIYDKGIGSYSSILMVSDGAYNVGADPTRSAESSRIPVFTIGIGDSARIQDLSITEIRANSIIYAGDSLRVQAVISGFKNAESVIRLKDEKNKTITEKNLSFHETGGEEKAELFILPGDAGLRRYSLRVDSINGESNLDNNERHFSVKVLPRKIDILLIAGAPSPDFTFLKRIFQRNPDIELSTLVEKDKKGFYYGKTYDNQKNPDAIILLNYPAETSNKEVLSDILSKISSGTSVMIIPGTKFRGEYLNEISNLIPLNFNRNNGEYSEEQIFPSENLSPLTRFFPEEYIISDLPPLTSVNSMVEFKDFASIAARFGNGLPAIGFSIQNGVKAAGSAVYDFWRLSLQDEEHAISDSLITHFWYNLIRWLSTKGDEDLFRFSTEKDIFSSGEKIPFIASIYDKSFRLVKDAEVTVTIKGAAGDTQIKLNKTSRGQFYNSTRIFAEGEYQIDASAVAGKDTLRYSGGFVVERFNPEYLNPAMRTDVLQGIAQNSGGEFYYPDQFDHFFEDFNPEPEIYVNKSEFRLFPRWIIAAVITTLLAIEWIIRKRKGML